MLDENYYGFVDPDAGYIDEDEEDMPEAERELAEDAQWKIIQKNTFTRWANEHLKKEGKSINDLQYDLSDGLNLISLVEALSGHKFKGVNRRPHFRTQKLENVTLTMRFLEDFEGLRLVNIDSSDIVDSRLKLILGLIWTLILHYSITLPTWEGEEELPSDEKGKGPSPKQRLLSWLNTKMPDKPVRNFTTDWNDGTAVGALVDACAPGLCPDWPEWQPKRALENAREAMDAAEQWMDVPQLIKPEEMINPRVDEKAMMTYLSQFPNAKLKPGAPLRPKSNPARVRAYGPGLQPEGNAVGAPARFTVDTFSAGKGDVEVIVLNPRGQKEPCEVIPNLDKNQSYSCAYRPTQEGEYRVIVKFSGKEIASSPFKVHVEGAAGDPKRVYASGPGLEPNGNQVGRRTFFNIFTTGAGAGNVDCVILDPQGRRDAIKPRITKQSEENYLVEYTPKEEGLHSVNVFFAGQPIPSSPFGVMVGPSVTRNNPIVPQQMPAEEDLIVPCPPPVVNNYQPPPPPTPPPVIKSPPGADGKLAYATGRGIQQQGMRVRDPGDFQVHTEDCGPGDAELRVKVTGPGGTDERCAVKKSGPHLYECRYTPQRAGPYVVNINYAGDPIQRSPFPVDVGPFKTSDIRAFGPGLRGGTVQKPALFVVETNGETGALGFSIEGPSEAKIDCEDNGDGSANVCYWPTAPGEYAVHILCDDEDIPKSPYMAQIVPDRGQTHPEKVKAFGPGLEPGVTVNQPAEFTVDVREAGAPAPLAVECFDDRGESVPMQLRDKGDGTFACKYTPKNPKKHTVVVSYDMVNIPKSPFRIQVQEASNPSKVRVYGPGIESATRNQIAHFLVDCTDAGPGDVGISVTDEVGNDVPIDTQEQPSATKGGIFRIEYTPRTAGPFYTVQVYFADKEIPKSPYRVPVKADFDINKIKVEGLETSVPVHKPQEFDVITAGAAGKAKPVVSIKTPNGLRVPHNIEEIVDGYAVSYTPNLPGPLKLAVEVNGQAVKGSPFDVQVQPPPIVEEAIEKQKKPVLQQQQQYPLEDPTYNIEALVDTDEKQNAPSEPEILVDWSVDDLAYKNVRAFGEGLIRAQVNKPAYFTIDSRAAPPAPLGVTVEGPSEAHIDCLDNRDGTCDVSYVVSEPGPYQINVLYQDEHVPGSPFTVVIAGDPRVDTSRIRAYGPGLQLRGVFKDTIAKFTVDAKPIDKTSAGFVKATLINPQRKPIACGVDPQGDGTYKCKYTAVEEGPHQVEIQYEGFPVPGSPFAVQISPGCDPSRVRAYGPGLEPGGYNNEPQHFTVDLDGAGNGSLGLAVEGPADANIQCRDNKDGTCYVEYLPSLAGTYDIIVKFNDTNIPGSPFHVPIRDRVDPGKVRCYGPGLEPRGARAGQPAVFTVDASRAGDGAAQVTFTEDHGSHHVRAAQIQPKLGATTPNVFDVTYVPESAGPCHIDVNFAGLPVPGSPFRQQVLPKSEAHRVIVQGEGVKPALGSIPASLHTTFTVDTRDAGQGELEITVSDPEGQSIPLDVDDHNDGTFDCFYRPEEIGKYLVRVKFGNQEHPESPYQVHATPSGRAEYCRILEGMDDIIPLNKEHCITVDKNAAGKGNLLVKVKSPLGRVMDHQMEDNRDGTVSIFYTPRVRGDHQICIKFGGQVIPNGQFAQKAASPDEMKEKPIEPEVVKVVEKVTEAATHSTSLMTTYHPVDFKLPIGPVFDYVKAEVRTPSGRTEEPFLIDNRDGTITVQFQPSERGKHQLMVWYNDRPIPGSPFNFHVDHIAGSGHVSAYGPGLNGGIAGESAHFTLVTRDAGAGGLSVAVEGPSKAEIQCRDNKDGTCSVSYVPLAPGEYNVIIKFLDKHIPGSPYIARILGDPYKRSQFTVGNPTEVSLNITETDIHNLSATVVAPSRYETACIVTRMTNGNLGVSFTPREPGEHLVNIYRLGQPIPKSPIKIYVSASDVGNASRVRVYGNGLQRGYTQDNNQFTVDTRNAGYGGLSLSIEGPSKVEIECQDQHDGTCVVLWKPQQAGTYIVNIRYADEHVPGSPFTVQVSGDTTSNLQINGFGSINNRITTASRSIHDILTEHAVLGSESELTLKIPGANVYELSAQVTAPSGYNQPCEIADHGNGQFAISFFPREVGLHTINVRHRGQPIPGSPFQFTVGPVNSGGAHKVYVSGTGISQGVTNNKNEFTINTREAGSGGLSIAIEGASKAEIDFEDLKDGNCHVAYRVSEPGDYLCSVKFNDIHVSGSPFRIMVNASREESTLVNNTFFSQNTTNTWSRDKGMLVGRPATFTLNYSGQTNISGGATSTRIANLRAQVQTPSGRTENAVVQQMLDNSHQHVVRFIPSENGLHWIHVISDDNGKEIAGSPFQLMVGQYDADPSSVVASGLGLTRGTVGEKNYFVVHTLHAGSGALSVTIDGPSKVQLNCQEREDGYSFTYVPTLPGEYLISVKYGGDFEIVGSPFKTVITGSSTRYTDDVFSTGEQSHYIVDSLQRITNNTITSTTAAAHSVVCQGQGIQQAYIGQINTFTVDASQGGSSVLYVGLSGPVRPCDEVKVKHLGNNKYSVSYTVEERGRHQLMVKWGDEHVPGSPFIVLVP